VDGADWVNDAKKGGFVVAEPLAGMGAVTKGPEDRIDGVGIVNAGADGAKTPVG
jgi:hypothetical protein